MRLDDHALVLAGFSIGLAIGFPAGAILALWP